MKEERERARERLKSVRKSSCPAVTHTGWREVGKGMEAVHRQARDREIYLHFYLAVCEIRQLESDRERERERQ